MTNGSFVLGREEKEEEVMGAREKGGNDGTSKHYASALLRWE